LILNFRLFRRQNNNTGPVCPGYGEKLKITVIKEKKNTDFNDDANPLQDVELNLFRALGLKEPLLRALNRQGFANPTAIQEKTIPLVLDGKDIIAGSATGSGKTLAFGAGIIQNTKPGAGIQALILTPTRELAEQVAKSLKAYSGQQPLKISAVYGGVSINPQIDELKRADVVVGTPGRILDHVQRKTVRFDKLRTLVLDEADTMLDMGFIVDVEKIIGKCPNDRQTLLFSATLTKEVDSVAYRHTKAAVSIMTEGMVDPGKLTQVYHVISNSLKFSLLVHLLKNEAAELAMVFCDTRINTDVVAKNLRRSGIEARVIHGGLSQNKRTSVIKQFHSKTVQVLVCTDIAARGLDIRGVSHVYNYDLPKDSKQYIHRIGRTARAGKEGKAISIITKRTQTQLARMLKDKSIEIAQKTTPHIERVNTLSLARR
jgi:ATP-dependent RNA helicase DeaD